MSTDSPHVSPRAAALEAARRRLRWLEVEAHRMKAQLARLEAEFEDGVADTLSENDESRAEPPQGFVSLDEQTFDDDQKASAIASAASASEFYAAAKAWPPIHDNPFQRPAETPQIVAPTKPASPLAPARSLLASFGIHIAVLLICLPLTYLALTRKQEPAPPQTNFVVENAIPDPAPVELDGSAIQGLDTQPTLFNETKADLAGDILSDLPTLEPTSVVAPLDATTSMTPGVPTGELGMLGTDAPTGERGPAKGNAAGGGDGGAGGIGGKGRGGQGGTAEFFGAVSQGERFVFIVDDSSSMKDGRLETAVAEIERSIGAMNRRQSFYVIFVSDKTYPMFYPQKAPDLLLATPENKKLLAQWLPKVRLASGKNRELIAAMDLAASLRPHAVFLLWDGDLRYSEAVRNDVMKHLAGPQPWTFAVHTLGMGTLSPESEQNLAAIAAARKGFYRRIDVPKPAMR